MTTFDYVTVKPEGAFLGGQPTTRYHDAYLVPHSYMMCCQFDVLQKQIEQTYGVKLLEYHYMQSATAEIADNEEPEQSISGTYGYIRIVYQDDADQIYTTQWIKFREYGSPEECLEKLYFDSTWALSEDGDSTIKRRLLGHLLKDTDGEL